VAETAATAARAATLAMVEPAAVRAEVEAAAVMDVARAAAVELEALCGSSITSSVSADSGTDDELKSRRHSWHSCTPRGVVVRAQTGADVPTTLRAGARVAAVPPMVAAAQTGIDTLAARSTEIVAFTGGAALSLRTGTMVTMGSRPLSRTLVPAAGGLPSPRLTTSTGPR
jgi:hypothetical protein